MSARDVLVVGAGQAGLQFVCSLRDGGFDGRVTLVGDDPHPPYQRPPLSKGYLKRSVGKDVLSLRAADFYTARQIDLVVGDRVVTVTRNQDGSGQAVCVSGRTIPFWTLVLATGARPRELVVDGIGAAGVHVLRTWFWSDQGGLKLQIAGLRDAADDIVVRDLADPAKLVVGYYRDGRMVAAEAVNAPADFMALRKALGAGATFEPSALADPRVPLKALLKGVSADAVKAG